MKLLLGSVPTGAKNACRPRVNGLVVRWSPFRLPIGSLTSPLYSKAVLSSKVLSLWFRTFLLFLVLIYPTKGVVEFAI
ncbi:hypothetical protein L484_001191 [Morus notabilis]|uniref:Uncharacterized protein n=1 Tax=Morus notabilis TaxID=981085 RepID=W9R1B2_9ROSA|nr:hypothetical protein L484_001191 [Morus notabilis]